MARKGICLGLDLGIGSLGWALIDFDNNVIIAGGVILWDVPQTDKDKVSLCKKRRNSRSIRRNIKRTADRKKAILVLLQDYGFVPTDANAQWFQTRKGEKQPFLLRVDGTKRKLTGREISQVLYNIAGGRGYINHGQGDADSKSDDGKVLKAISQNKSLMEEFEALTFSEALLKKSQAEATDSMVKMHGKWRNRAGDYTNCFSKEMIQHDLSVIFDIQQSLGQDKLTQDFIDDFNDALWWEKENEDYDDKIYATVGNCCYFPELKRAAKSTYSNELCSAWEKLTHIRIVPFDGPEEKLTTEKKLKYINILFSPTPISKNKSCAVKYSNIRKDKDLGARTTFKGVEKEDTEVFAPKGFRKIRSCVSPDLMVKFANDRDLLDEAIEALTYASSETSLAEAISSLDLTNEEKDEIKKIPFNSKIFKGYCNRSLEALDLLIGTFEAEKEFKKENQFESLYEVEEACGLAKKRIANQKGEGLAGNRLPAYEDSIDPSCKNPVVLRCMANLRKCVNTVIDKYGMPDEIHIEVGTELKKSKHEKAIIKSNNDNRNALKKAVLETAAKELGVPEDELGGELVQKLIFAEEQGWKDLIADKDISFKDLCHYPWLYEIDHILPLSRSCDNSQNNKHLVLKKTNDEKSNQTPYEFIYGKNKDNDWVTFKNRVLNQGKLSRKKKNNLLCEDFKDRESAFIERNLNDTRYASRLAKSYLEKYLAFEDDGKAHVFCNSGMATSLMRSSLGLKKDREADNRHHFVDACLIAACTPGNIQRIAKANAFFVVPKSKEEARAKREYLKKSMREAGPWPSFADDVDEFMNSIYAVRRSNHKVTGEMFEQTVYRFEGLNDKNKAILSYKKDGKLTSTVNGNFVIKEDGKTTLIRSEQAFVRLWWDPEFYSNKGKYLVEVVFKSDLGALKNGSYIPRFIPKANEPKNRNEWDPVPERAKKESPLLLFSGDCLEVGDVLLRYVTTGIADGKLVFVNMNNNLAPAKGTFKTIKEWGNSVDIKVINEDILGECFR